MALSRGTSVGTPKIYIDYIQYLTTINAIDLYDGENNVWDMNPAKEKAVYTGTANIINFKSDDVQLLGLINSANYFAVLGHNNTEVGNFALNSESQFTIAPFGASQDSQPGYNIDAVRFSGQATSYEVTPAADAIVGAYSVGRAFTFPNAPDLDVSVSLSHEGVKVNRTIGGRDIIDVKYHSQPKWIGRTPWTYGDANYSKYTGSNGRRSWKVKFSYLDHDDVFPADMNEGFLFDNYANSSLLVPRTQENIISHFLTLTLSGSLKFIFQPDKTLDQFALCRLSKPSSTIKQVAHKTYDISFTFVETW